MDNEQRLISNKISKPMLTKGRTYLETKESTNSIENTNTEANGLNTNTKSIVTFPKYKSFNVNAKQNKYLNYQISISNNDNTSINDKDAIITQRTTVESFYEPKIKQSINSLIQIQTLTNQANASKTDSNKNILILEKKKSIHKPLFEIEPEDEIFNSLQKKEKKRKKKMKIIKKKPLTGNEIKLNTLYCFKKDSENKINLFKKSKRRFTLLEYQTKLLDLNRNILSIDSMNKLDRTFTKIRCICSKRYAPDYSSLYELQEKEKRIISRVNYQNNALSNLLNISQERKEAERVLLPELKFTHVRFKPKQNKRPDKEK